MLKKGRKKLYQSFHPDPYQKLMGSNPADKPQNIWKMDGTRKKMSQSTTRFLLYTTVQLNEFTCN